MNGPFEDDFPPELLAAYADGELPPDLSDRVSRMLENDPVAESLVGDQLSLSPANHDWLRDTAVPPKVLINLVKIKLNKQALIYKNLSTS